MTGPSAESGHGPAPVVFLHGAGMDHTVWRFQTRWLAHHGRRVLAPDLPGHGAASGEPRRSIPEWGEWFVSYLASQVEEPAILVGHSMGGLISLEAAAAAPERLHRLLLVGVGPRMVPHSDLMTAAHDDLARAAELIAGWSMPPANRGRHPEPGLWEQGAAAALVRRSAPGVLAADLGCCAAYDASPAAAAVACPVTVVAGPLDRMASLREARELSGLFPAAELIVLEGQGHEPMLQSPRVFNRLLGEILKADGKPSAG